jgi:hypothetical protein
MEEEYFRVKSKTREIVAQQRIKERFKKAKKLKKINLDKCPLLTKPAHAYKNKIKQAKISQNDFNSNSSYFFTQVYNELNLTNTLPTIATSSPDIVDENLNLKHLVKV